MVYSRPSWEDERPLLEPQPQSYAFVEIDDADFGGSEERQRTEASLLRKLDMRMSVLVVIYILNYIDRNAAAAARLRGFEEDLHLEGQQFATILSILYVGYILMQVPSNMILNHFQRPSIQLPVCMIVWGMLSVLTGFTTGFWGAFTTRFFLGFVEAAFFPSALFILSKWYTRKELGARTAILTCGMLVSNAFGALIASAILDTMQGVLGFAAWRWLFFIEGSLTVLVAIVAVYILPDFPETPARWLTQAESELAKRRMAADATHGSMEDDESQIKGFFLAINDGKVWYLSTCLLFMVTSFSFSIYFPTLTATLGYSRTVSLLLCAPPWFFSAACSYYVAQHSDIAGERTMHIVGPILVGELGFVLAFMTMNPFVRYFSLFLMAQGYSAFIVFIAWVSSSISHPASKRAVSLAFINATSQMGNIFGSYLWPKSWGPSYQTSYTFCIVISAVAIVMNLLFRRHLEALNAKAANEVGGQRKAPRYML